MTPIFQQCNGFLNSYMENDLHVYLKNKVTGIRLELDNTLKDYIVQPQIIIYSGESLMSQLPPLGRLVYSLLNG